MGEGGHSAWNIVVETFNLFALALCILSLCCLATNATAIYYKCFFKTSDIKVCC